LDGANGLDVAVVADQADGHLRRSLSTGVGTQLDRERRLLTDYRRGLDAQPGNSHGSAGTDAGRPGANLRHVRLSLTLDCQCPASPVQPPHAEQPLTVLARHKPEVRAFITAGYNGRVRGRIIGRTDDSVLDAIWRRRGDHVAGLDGGRVRR